ncbi:hypothetical protein T07_14021 [Trichinella nelsoni]|uniref:Uncharacterized protein n=1 Tax=Trichinella nelsoni TaxID=6336 RepID=A0A0V0RFG8_9BILA|nr:hypothetical protein T07_14021 [Trichinella nelsoni]
MSTALRIEEGSTAFCLLPFIAYFLLASSNLPQICSDAVAKGDFNTMAKSKTDKLPTAALAHSYSAGTGIGDF